LALESISLALPTPVLRRFRSLGGVVSSRDRRVVVGLFEIDSDLGVIVEDVSILSSVPNPSDSSSFGELIEPNMRFKKAPPEVEKLRLLLPASF